MLFIVIIEWKNTEMNTESLFNKKVFVIAFLFDNPFSSVHCLSNAKIYLSQVSSETCFLLRMTFWVHSVNLSSLFILHK